MGFWPVVENVIKNSDILLIVADVRMPELTKNSELERKISQYGKTIIHIFNKIDLVSEGHLEEKKRLYPDAFLSLRQKILESMTFGGEFKFWSKKKGLKEPRIGVVGYPNIGKSALINVLARRKRAKVADRPGTTRGTQWIKSGGLLILDSPGVIPYEDKGSKLVFIGSRMGDTAQQPEKIALDIIKLFLFKDKTMITKNYRIEIEKDDKPHDLLLKIGKKRGFLKKGGIVDETKTSIVIIRDWQKGKLRL